MAYFNGYYPPLTYGYPQQSYQNNNIRAMEWVDGEVGAKAFQMPAGWPVNTPIALWDNSEKKIWLKSWNAVGMPNPMQELCYEIKERPNPITLPENISSSSESPYATKQEFEQLREEIQNLAKMMQGNTKTSSSRGGN